MGVLVALGFFTLYLEFLVFEPLDPGVCLPKPLELGVTGSLAVEIFVGDVNTLVAGRPCCGVK